MKLITVYTTVGTLEDAQRIARSLVERGLAACAHITKLESFYTWKGALHNDDEVQIAFITTKARYAALEQAIRELHPYELPAIYATEVVAAYAPYAQWVTENSS